MSLSSGRLKLKSHRKLLTALRSTNYYYNLIKVKLRCRLLGASKNWNIYEKLLHYLTIEIYTSDINFFNIWDIYLSILRTLDIV